MNLGSQFLNVSLAVLFTWPPVYDPTDVVVKRLRAHEIRLIGRDPCANIGLHCALLPVYVANDVDSVGLPSRGYTLHDLRSLSHLGNLRCISSIRSLTKRQYDVLNSAVSKKVWFDFNVRLENGTFVKLRSPTRRRRNLDADVNGDGVVDESEGIDGETHDHDPPRITKGK
ncbi:hypothetical protein Enr13x_66420 [Stieleria neptunia]|uniref:Uncharacterized protein n=1 Tax=Stieleria neptunia TaxID=2527979 RepID=A0A518I0W9_9BACT|nr:hypothetical protein Enr13x_66420 [Stieleria neptunia]